MSAHYFGFIQQGTSSYTSKFRHHVLIPYLCALHHLGRAAAIPISQPAARRNYGLMIPFSALAIKYTPCHVQAVHKQPKGLFKKKKKPEEQVAQCRTAREAPLISP